MSETNESGHTPGPWHIEDGECAATGGRMFYLVGGDEPADQAPIATVYRDNAVWLREGEAEANAALIEAAPDLLEACMIAERVLRRPFDPAAEDAARVALRAAIARALSTPSVSAR